MNARWNRARSRDTHDRLRADPTEWEQYHSLYRQARASWPVVPLEALAEMLGKMRSGKVIGDFACGEAELATRLRGRHTVHSFDHVAIDEAVVSCDMADVPLADGALDVAVFSLSLMGANAAEYLREAHRCLDLGGTLIVVEAASRIDDETVFDAALRALGFDVAKLERRDRVIFVTAVRADRSPRDSVSLGL